MVGSLGSVVNGSDQALRRVTGLHLIGLVVGALLVGSFLTVTGAAARSLGLRPVILVVAVLSVAGTASQLVGTPALQSQWQVPEHWRRIMSGDVLALFYGFLLGLGMLTAVVVTAFWAFVALSILVQPPLALAGWTVYALTRGLSFHVSASSGHVDTGFTAWGRRKLVSAALVVSLAAVLATI